MTTKHFPISAVRVVKAEEQKIIMGEVYAPYVVDSHGDMMLPEDVEKAATRFMAEMKTRRIDVEHDNMPISAVVVESFISRGNPSFTEGAWVVAIRVDDPVIWDKIKQGVYNGFSLEFVGKVVRDVPVTVTKTDYVFGVTESNEGHDHAFFARVDDQGRVLSGYTSRDKGHDHVISRATATLLGGDGAKHAHRFFLT